jgi:hypothetical protein
LFFTLIEKEENPMWKNIALSSYIILLASSVLGVAFGILGWPEPLHILLIWVSGLLFTVATILNFKLVQIHKTDTRIYELEEDNTNLRTARKLDRKDLDEMKQNLQTLIRTRFSEFEAHSEKEIMEYAKALEAPPTSNFTEKIKSLPLLKKFF